MAFVSSIIAGGSTILGGLLGRRNSAPQQTTQQQLDPRIAERLYGSDGNSGLLGNMGNWYNQNASGLNQQMVDGLNQQNSVYRSPLATQGYERMGQTGYALMGRGVAANPFTSGQMPQFGNWGARQQVPQSTSPPPMQRTQDQQSTSQPPVNQGLLAPSFNGGFTQQGQQAFTLAPTPTPTPTPQVQQQMATPNQSWWDWYNDPSNNARVI